MPALLSAPTLRVTFVDSTGHKQGFIARHVAFNFGAGNIEILPGRRPFCRGFDNGVMTLTDGTSVTRVKVTRGLTSFMGNGITVVCHRAVTLPPEPGPTNFEGLAIAGSCTA